ncbi:DNA-binding protein [Streptomyces nodosus]|uniref:DNA-binding protein n=1 Tax=Streptomyces nodosus TaxID=40318 RepID=UPI0034569EA7
MITAPITPLTSAEQRVAEYLVHGLKPRAIADETQRSPNTITDCIRTVRRKIHCPPRSPLHILVHYLLSTGTVTPPPATSPPPDLTPRRRALLEAVTEHTNRADIARAADLAPHEVPAEVDTILAETGAADITELVVLAHTWHLLQAGQRHGELTGADR